MDNNKNRDISSLRKNYTKDGIRDENLPSDPLPMFRRWIDEAIDSAVNEPNAMSLATVSESGQPNVRVVLLKEIKDDSIHFYTNYLSQKGKELDQNPYAAVSFWWPELERQVRIRGPVKKLSRVESDKYFQSRPRESQIGAWVSDQSSPVPDREALIERFKLVSDQYKEEKVPTPEYWGGYSIQINEVEFWQGRPGRMHDRILYVRFGNNWKKERLQP